MRIRGLPLMLISLVVSACAASGTRIYSRSFQEPPEVLWYNILQKVQTKGESVKKINSQKKRITLRKSLSLNEVYEYSNGVPPNLASGGDAEIELWVEPDPAGGSLLKSQAALYSTVYDYLRPDYLMERSNSQRYDSDYEFERQRRELTPIVLESNGLLEMYFLGYSKD